jgi:hypothetical protein
MINMKLLVCGTRQKYFSFQYQNLVYVNIFSYRWIEKNMPLEIIEGCCKRSADEYAEECVEDNDIPIHHFPANRGNYIKRNIEMVDACDEILAFWDGFSYGTAHTIATAVLKNKPVKIVDLSELKKI